MATPSDVIDEFHLVLNDASAVFGTARSALPWMSGRLQEFAALAGLGPDHLVHLSVPSESTEDGPSDAFAAWPYRQLPSALGVSGPVAQQIGHQWLVHVYHLWEDNFREKIALSRGLNTKNDLKNPHFGDLGLIRHDILKHRGIASPKNSGRCQMLKWFRSGDAIIVTEKMVYEFMAAFGLAHPAPGSLTESRITLYGFQGLIESPISLRADGKVTTRLLGELRRLSGYPLDLETLRRQFVGAQMAVDLESQVAAVGKEIRANPLDASRATVVFHAPEAFVSEVRDGSRTAVWRIGSGVPQHPDRRAIPVKWFSDRRVVAEAVAPNGKWYDPADFYNSYGALLPLTSSFGDMADARLLRAEHGPKGMQFLHLHLEVEEAVAARIRAGKTSMFVSLLLPRA